MNTVIVCVSELQSSGHIKEKRKYYETIGECDRAPF